MEPVLNGLITGLAMMVFIGPVFFTLIQIALENGIKSGAAVALGIFVSDITCVTLCYFGAGPLVDSINNPFWLAVVGGTILLILGLKYFIKPKVNTESVIHVTHKDLLTFFSKGFAVNLINPFVFMVWIGIITFAKEKFTSTVDTTIYLSTSLIVIISTDILKVFLAQYLKKFIQPNILVKVYKIIGLVLIGFSIRLFLYAV